MSRNEARPLFVESEESYRHILAQDPNHDGAHHFLGVSALRAGRLDAAIEHLRRAAEIQPTISTYHINLGTALAGRKRLDEAIVCFRRALELTPDVADAHNNLGVALQQHGRLHEAIASYRRALELRPEYADAHKNLSNALAAVAAPPALRGEADRPIETNAGIEQMMTDARTHEQAGQRARAEALYRQIIAKHPDHDAALHRMGMLALQDNRLHLAIDFMRRACNLKPTRFGYHNDLGIAYKAAGKVDEAIACYRRALELNPDLTEAHYNLGEAFQTLGKLDEAAASYGRSLELSPGYAAAHNNLGNVRRDQGKFEEALASFQRALELKPGNAVAYVNLGNVYRDLDRPDEALACWRQALEVKPGFAEAYNNVASVLQDQGKLDEALANYRQAFELKPEYAEARSNWSLLSLLRGDFERGWPEYEWRLLTVSPRRAFVQPRWDGSPLAGRTILLHAEQGFGDTIQFSRYAGLVAQSGGNVIVECQKRLGRLLRGSLGGIAVVDKGEPAPSFDVQCPLASLPMVFRTTLPTIPRHVPYLSADTAAAARWQAKLAGNARFFKVGLAWAGNKTHKNDRKRSLRLEALMPLARVPGVRFYSLQKGEQAQQAWQPPAGMDLIDWTDELDDFADTAALVANLDLIISVDTSVTHLAGALGRPVWTLLPFAPDWRWLLDRDDSPWYPTMRLFRQTAPGDWAGAIDRVADALGRCAGSEAAFDAMPAPSQSAFVAQPAAVAPAASLDKSSRSRTMIVDPNLLLENGHVRLKRCRHGLMLYLENDRYVGRSLDLYGEFSEAETDLFRLIIRPGWTVLEIGANMGAHTPSLATMVGPHGAVHAFEPQRVIFQILCANIALNALSNVHAHHAAVGRTAGAIAVPKLDYSAVNNFGGLSLGDLSLADGSVGRHMPETIVDSLGRTTEGDPVPVMTIDSMNLSACDMLKIDVEGMEGEVVAGAEKTIARFRPALYLENDRDKQSAALIRQLLNLDYRLYWHFPPLFNRDNYFHASENVFGRIVSVNMLGLHRSFPQNIQGLREITFAEDTWRESKNESRP